MMKGMHRCDLSYERSFAVLLLSVIVTKLSYKVYTHIVNRTTTCYPMFEYSLKFNVQYNLGVYSYIAR